MNGYDLGRAVGGTIITMIIVAAFAGALVAVGGYLGISWLMAHVTIGFV